MFDEQLVQDKHIIAILGKALAGGRLDYAEGLALLQSHDLLAIGAAADKVNQRRNGSLVHYVKNFHINYTNVCVNRCRFCSYMKAEGEVGGYTMDLATVEAEVRRATAMGVREFHIVGGCNPALPFDYYLDLIATVRAGAPDATIKAFTATEIKFIAERGGVDVDQVLTLLRKRGLNALPGGGAEIFDDEVRKKICPNKIDGEGWLAVMATAHGLGIKSNATMLFGHIEPLKARIDHLLALRDQQDRGGGFLAFLPIPYHPENNELTGIRPAGGNELLKMIAVSRLMLDNFVNIKAYWVMLGLKLAQVAMHFGANDLDGTVVQERIFHDAGATTPQALTEDELRNLVTAAGRTPVERDGLYGGVGGQSPQKEVRHGAC